MKKLCILLFCLIILSNFVFAQIQYGNIRGIVLDEGGNPLPGVTVTLDSDRYSDRATVTSKGGIFRFLNLAIGKCSVKCELSGFKTFIQENIIIQIGSNVDLKIIMDLASLEEEVTVVAQTPVIDMKRTGAAVNITQEVLQEIPSARDPWAVLKQVPGMFVSRENVGGSESGQQPNFGAKGAYGHSNMYNMDGIPITDMVALGASSRYYDYDSFEEMQIVTTGQETSIQTGGVSINFITRRGTNKFQVVARAFFTNDKLQSDNRTQELIDLDYVGDRIEQILDYGLQVGGPIIKDRLWFWFGYGAQDIRRLKINGFPEHTELGGINTKVNFSISRKNKAEIAFIRYLKNQYGRYSGPFNPPETTTDLGGDGSPFFKFEDNHYFSDNFLLTLKLAHNWGAFWMEPRGGLDVQMGYDNATKMWSGSNLYARVERHSYNALLDGNYFVENILGGDHEFKFGVEYRKSPSREHQIYPGDAFKGYWNGAPYAAGVYREGVWDYSLDRYSVYLMDTFTRRRLTLKLGFRLDREKSVVNQVSMRASRVAPDLLQAITVPAVDPDVVWLTFSPRLGFTFDLTGHGKTLLRGNVARYGIHSQAWIATQVSVQGLAWAMYQWWDTNGDDIVTTDELIGYPNNVWAFSGFDPWNPTVLESPNGIDINLKSMLVDEILLGVEREIFQDFSLSVAFTYRRNHRFSWDPYYDKKTDTKETQADWTGPIQKSLTYEGITYDYEYWTLKQYRYVGDYKENRPSRNDKYAALELVATKRLSNKWMMSASLTLQNLKMNYGEMGILDPTNMDKFEGGGGEETGSSRWLAKLSFLYQLPWGFNFSCFAHAREGYGYTQYLNVRTPERSAVGLGGSKDIYLEKQGSSRLQNFYNVDMSLVKEFVLGNYGRLSLQVDVFNVFNSAHVLNRVYQVNSPSYNDVTRILNPRVIRFGVRYRF